MKRINLDEINGPEFYMEETGHDVRIAISRLNDVAQTIGDSSLSLIYSDEKEHTVFNDMEMNIIRRFHLRHAIIDLNSSFDVILQVLWFYYRIWQEYNTGGSLENQRNGRYNDTFRNTDNWVEKSSEYCKFNRVIGYLENSTDTKLNELSNKLKSFKNGYIFNENKNFTVRSLSNAMKHKSAIRFKELCKPYNFNIEFEGGVVNLKDNGLITKFCIEFYDKDEGKDLEKSEGVLYLEYSDDLYLDIKFKNGEYFRAEDYLGKRHIYELNEVHKECIEYHDSLIDIYEFLYRIIHEDISWSPILKVSEKVTKSSSINFDKYFKDNSFKENK